MRSTALLNNVASVLPFWHSKLLDTKYGTVGNPGSIVWLRRHAAWTVRSLRGLEVKWACTMKSRFFPLCHQLFNIAEIADDGSGGWPLCIIISVFSHTNGPLGYGSPCFWGYCCLHRPHSPLDSMATASPLASTPIYSSLTDWPIGGKRGDIVLMRLLLVFRATIFSSLFLFKQKAYTNLCKPLCCFYPLLHSGI